MQLTEYCAESDKQNGCLDTEWQELSLIATEPCAQRGERGAVTATAQHQRRTLH